MCEQQGIIFIGPTAAQLDALGDKLRARAAAVAADVPVVPGGAGASVAEAEQLARRIGMPLLVKAVGGGGGRGMQLVHEPGELAASLELASAEAGAAFGDARVYLERYIARGRHIEVQVLGDGEGRVIHLGERDCSVQRRYQKLLEESPAPRLAADLRRQLLESAVRFAARLRYRNAGTVEFLVDCEREAFYFLEMNARIQVEHPVTEAVTGVDLVAEQLAVACGEGLRLGAEASVPRGCAIECRINAEDPTRNQPTPERRMSLAERSGSRSTPCRAPGCRSTTLSWRRSSWRGGSLTAPGRCRERWRRGWWRGYQLACARHCSRIRVSRGGVDTGFLARFWSATLSRRLSVAEIGQSTSLRDDSLCGSGGHRYRKTSR